MYETSRGQRDLSTLSLFSRHSIFLLPGVWVKIYNIFLLKRNVSLQHEAVGL